MHEGWHGYFTPLLAEMRPALALWLLNGKGDIHDIGKNLVSMMLEGAGFDVIDMVSIIRWKTIWMLERHV